MLITANKGNEYNKGIFIIYIDLDKHFLNTCVFIVVYTIKIT